MNLNNTLGELRVEDRLVAAARSGDGSAFAELCAPVTPKVFSTLLQITGNREDAEDALQDALLQAYRHIGSFQAKSKFSTWLTRVAINSGLMLLRKKNQRREVFLSDGTEEIDVEKTWKLFDTRPNPEDRLAIKQRSNTVRAAVQDLRPTLRRAVELVWFSELPLRDAAEELGVSPAATKGRLFHGRAALRKSRRLAALRASGKSVRFRVQTSSNVRRALSAKKASTPAVLRSSPKRKRSLPPAPAWANREQPVFYSLSA